MNAQLIKIKEKIKTFFDKNLKNKKDINLNSSVNEDKKMHENMKMY